MKSYTVIGQYHGSCSRDVKAKSPEAAAGQTDFPSLCYECSSEFNLSDTAADGVTVLDEAGEEVFVEASYADTLNETVDALTVENERLRLALVRLGYDPDVVARQETGL